MTDLASRNAKRYPVAVPVDFWWPSADGEVQSSQGMTRDVSISGVMVATIECPPVGVRIQMTVHLPGSAGRGHGLELHGEGVVVRVQDRVPSRPNDLTHEFAAWVQFHSEKTIESADSAFGRIEV